MKEAHFFLVSTPLSLLLLHDLFVGLNAFPLAAVTFLILHPFLHPLPLFLLLDQVLRRTATAILPASQVLSRVHNVHKVYLYGLISFNMYIFRPSLSF